MNKPFLPGLGVKRAKGQRPSFLDGDKERGMSVASIFLSVKRFLTDTGIHSRDSHSLPGICGGNFRNAIRTVRRGLTQVSERVRFFREIHVGCLAIHAPHRLPCICGGNPTGNSPQHASPPHPGILASLHRCSMRMMTGW